MKFDDKRTGTGTLEWAEVNENICCGCPNDCLYCYAAANAKRFKLRSRDKWNIEKFTKRSLMTSYPAKNGVIMFPSSHDITLFNVDRYIKIAKLILRQGNQLLIVSKPRLECIKKLVSNLGKYKKQILFRFTIGTLLEDISLFWEPGASLPGERLNCLIFTVCNDFNTSVSIEPMLGGIQQTESVVKVIHRHVSDTIWIGKMNKTNLRVDTKLPHHKAAVQKIQYLQRDEEIIKMYKRLKDDPVIRWKDSIKSVLTEQ